MTSDCSPPLVWGVTRVTAVQLSVHRKSLCASDCSPAPVRVGTVVALDVSAVALPTCGGSRGPVIVLHHRCGESLAWPRFSFLLTEKSLCASDCSPPPVRGVTVVTLDVSAIALPICGESL